MKPYSSSALSFLSLLLLVSTPIFAQQTIQLQQQMSSSEFKASGLEKLSPAELRHLQQWLSDHSDTLAASQPASKDNAAASTAGSPAAGNRRRPANQESGRAGTIGEDIVTSKIAGNFNGWDRGSILTLQNGQKWRVTNRSSLTVRETMVNPTVTVEKGFLGTWFLKVRGYNTTAKVELAN